VDPVAAEFDRSHYLCFIVEPFLPTAPDDFFIKPSAIADELWHLYNQDRSAWSFLTELRPFGEKW